MLKERREKDKKRKKRKDKRKREEKKKNIGEMVHDQTANQAVFSLKEGRKK
jgi:hypothetical protein